MSVEVTEDGQTIWRISPCAFYLKFHEAGRDPREEHDEQFACRPFLASAFDAMRNVVDADPPKLPELPPSAEDTQP